MTHGLDTSFLVAAEVASHSEHRRARARLQKLLKAGDTVSLAPLILAEFIHVVTDPRRFSKPLTTDQAVARAEDWWNATEVVRLPDRRQHAALPEMAAGARPRPETAPGHPPGIDTPGEWRVVAPDAQRG